MHCDDKRTEYALKQYVIEATQELYDLQKKIAGNIDDESKMKIQKRISFLEKSISDSKEQLSQMS